MEIPVLRGLSETGMVTKCVSVRGLLCRGNHVPVVGDTMLPAEALSLSETGLSPPTPRPICSWLGCYSLDQESWLSRSGKRSSLPGCKGPRFGKLSELKKRPSRSSSLLSAKSIIVPFTAFLNVLSYFVWKWTMGYYSHPFPPPIKSCFIIVL